MKLRDIDIHELLPQQEPFVMVGCLTDFDMKRTVTETVIKPDNIFVEDGVFTAPGITENIAQTCAARLGYINKYILKKGVDIGFIGAIRNLEFFDFPLVGDSITTTIDTLEDVFGMTLVEARVERNGTLVATCTMKIAVKPADADDIQ